MDSALFSFKQRAAALVAAFFVVWPFVHSGLVRAYEVEAWKLGAWGMYSTYRNRLDVDVYARDAGGEIIMSSYNMPRKVERIYDDFFKVRMRLGKFVEPDDVAAAIFLYVPPAESVEIRVGLRKLDPKTSMMAMYPEVFEYER